MCCRTRYALKGVMVILFYSVISTKCNAWRNPLRRSSTTLVKYPTLLSFRAQAWNLLERHRCSFLTLGDLSTALEMTIPFLVVIQRVEKPEESPGKVILSLSSFRPSETRGEIP